MSHPLPIATFDAGQQRTSGIKYPHLPRSIPVHFRHVTYPGLSKTGHKAPATKCPMGMTLPILTKHGGHPLDTATSLPPIGNR
jgi:hypothetical protein